MLSGVNRGHNVAEDTLYSGTVGGAMEAALHGMRAGRALAVLRPGDRAAADPFAAARAHGAALLRRLLDAAAWPTDPYAVFYNVNFPPVPGRGVRGTRATFQGYRAAPTFGVAAARRPERPHLPLADPRPRQRRQPARLGFPRMPRRLDHRHAAQAPI